MKRTCNLMVGVLGILLPLGCRAAPEPSPTPAGAQQGAGPQQSAEYTVTVASSWTAASHPHEYPEAGVLTGPHYSGLIGAAHGADFTLFREGGTPTPGLERLSEEGKHSPLDDEIKAAIGQGKAGALFESDPLRDFSKTVTTTVRVTDKHPMVSAVAMLAPSPDWFTGAANVNLREGGQWVPSKQVTLYAWDSGGDDGKTYKASDADTNPKKPTTMAATPHFVVNGNRVAVGTLTFTKR